ncbi:phosphopyruvate hydratase, partial [Candidatus Wolfebacteria bacterium CG18_big_fil_WC_8_21_14_2_50_39_7]
SRGQDTLEAELKSGDFSAIASVPAGKSTGAHEAFVLEPKKALEKFESIKPQILSREFESQKDFDYFLISLDATQNKQNLGANLILVLSLAWARLKAKSENKELFEYIRNN